MNYFFFSYFIVSLLYSSVFSSTTWTRIDSTCFQADKTRVTQQKATEICKERGGVLHSIKDSQEFGALKSVLGLSFHYWVSVKKINNSKCFLNIIASIKNIFQVSITPKNEHAI